MSVQTLGLQKGAQSEQGLRNCNGGKTTSPRLEQGLILQLTYSWEWSLKLLLTCVLHTGMEELSLFQSTPDVENWISELQSIVNSSARPRTQSEARMLSTNDVPASFTSKFIVKLQIRIVAKGWPLACSCGYSVV